MDRKLRVLVADDSALMRREIKKMIESSPDLEVVGVAKNGQEACDMCKSLDPDVVTLDINMPVLDGLSALQQIMSESARPVIMFSSLTQEGAVTTYEAMELGAFDFVAKPGGTVSTNIQEVTEDLVTKIKAASRARIRRGRKRASGAASKPKASLMRSTGSSFSGEGIVVIGQSTGGPNTIMELLPHIPENFPVPVLVVQHMPAAFTPSFAERLNRNCAIPFKEAQSGDILLPGQGYLAPGDFHMILTKRAQSLGGLAIRLTKIPSNTIHCPAVDVTMSSALEFFGQNTFGVLLTGMGDDGAEAMVKIRKAGGFTIAESEETAIVFGMPKEAILRGGAEAVLPCHEIGPEIVRLVMERFSQRKGATL